MNLYDLNFLNFNI